MTPTPIDVTDTRSVRAASSEPILKAGLSVSGAVAATIALLDRVGVPVIEGDAAIATAFISVVLIPIGTWYFARQKTVPVAKADAAIQVASNTPASVPVTGFAGDHVPRT